MRVRAALVLGVLGTVSCLAQTPEEIVRWTTHGQATANAGTKLEVVLHADIQSDWHVYSISQMPGGPTRMIITVPEHQPFERDGSLNAPLPRTAFDPNFNIDTETYEGSVQIKVPIRVAKDAPVGGQKLAIDVLFQTCNDTTCLPPHTTHLYVPIKIGASTAAGATGVPVSAAPAGAASESLTAAPVLESAPATHSPTSSGVQATPEASAPRFGSFTWLAMVMGALSLLTPCVFPMIPITVSYFTNYAGTSRRGAVLTAVIYGISIILTFTALGMLLAVAFGAGGVNQLAANPWINLLITAIFLGFAFSLFGVYFIQVPPSLMGKLETITRSRRGAIGALLMGFTFTLTSFTCTAPSVGTLLVMTALGNWRWPLVGMLAFSTVFAIPFFLLALAPQLMSKLPKAGGWMGQIKVVMGFLEIAAAMKFLSNADLVWRWGIFTRQVVLAVWVSVGILTVLYVLGYFQMQDDSGVGSFSAGRLSAAVISMAVTIWLVPGLFGRPLGELESFLPPDLGGGSSISKADSTGSRTLASDDGWILNDYQGALSKAKQENKFVFIDFTGYTCTNCRWMEANMFPRPEVTLEMEKFVRVRLYTDGAGDLFEHQQKMQQVKFGTVALPLYAIVQPDGTTVATFPGLTRNSNEFLAFLKKGTP